MEVVDFLFAFAFSVCPVADLCQRFVGILIGVDISIPAVRVGFLQEVAAVCFQTAFAYPSAQGIVAVRPRFFHTVFFEDFRLNQLVMQIIEIVLHLAVGQFPMDEVAELVVVIGRAVVGFQAVVGDGIEVV